MIIIEMPWGEKLDGSDPDIPALLFAWQHFLLAHRYTVTGESGSFSIACECGETLTVPH